MFFDKKNIISLIFLILSTQINLLSMTTPAIQVKIPWPDPEGLFGPKITVSIALNLSDRAVQNIGLTNNFCYSSQDVSLEMKTEGGTSLIIVGGNDKNFFKDNLILSSPINFDRFMNLVFQEEADWQFPNEKLFVIIRRFIVFAAIKTIIETFFKFSTTDGQNFLLMLLNPVLFENQGLTSNLQNNYGLQLLELVDELEKLIDQKLERASKLRHSFSSIDRLTSERFTDCSDKISTGQRPSSLFENSGDLLKPTQNTFQPILDFERVSSVEPSFDCSEITFQVLDLHGKTIIADRVLKYLLSEMDSNRQEIESKRKEYENLRIQKQTNTQINQTPPPPPPLSSIENKKPKVGRGTCHCLCLRFLLGCCCPCSCCKK